MRDPKKVRALERPFHLTFLATGTTYPLTSEEAQRLLDEYPILEASRNRAVLRADDGHKTVITPATLGGGAAFEVTR